MATKQHLKNLPPLNPNTAERVLNRWGIKQKSKKKRKKKNNKNNKTSLPSRPTASASRGIFRGRRFRSAAIRAAAANKSRRPSRPNNSRRPSRRPSRTNNSRPSRRPSRPTRRRPTRRLQTNNLTKKPTRKIAPKSYEAMRIAAANLSPRKTRSGRSFGKGKTRRKIKINPKMKGAFTRKAKRAKMTVKKYANHIIKKYKGKTKNKAQLKLLRQANFVKVSSKWAKRRRK